MGISGRVLFKIFGGRVVRGAGKARKASLRKTIKVATKRPGGSGPTRGAAAGRPRLISDRRASQLHALIKKLQHSEGSTAEVGAERIFRAWKSKACSLKTLKKWISSNYVWRPPSTRLQLKPGDAADRSSFKRRYRGEGALFWKDVIFLDGHAVRKAVTLRASTHVAQSRCRGQYRRLDGKKAVRVKDLPPRHTRASKKLRFNTGGTYKFIIGCNHDRGIFFLHLLKAPAPWGSSAASNMYAALRRAVGGTRKLTILEDNDPVWKERGSAEQREAHGFRLLPGGFPRRSPDLNPLDFGINAELDKRVMRLYARNPRQRVSRADFVKSVEKVAKSKSMTQFTRKCIASMPRRVRGLDPRNVT